MKILRLLKHNKLRAATARRSSAGSAGMDFEEMPEPNMKLSRALLIVLLLHVVAVSGIIAFNAIKTRESSFVPASSTKMEPKPSATAYAAIQTDGAKPQTATAQKENAPSDDPKPSHSPKLALKDDPPNAPSDGNRPSSRGRGTIASQEATAAKPVSDGKTYVVKKGDSPVTIAKKLKVPYDDLMVLNHIEDPRKLRIGQKLLIPKITKPKKTDGKAVNAKGKKSDVRHAKQKARST
jgi:LysM repeat protein